MQHKSPPDGGETDDDGWPTIVGDMNRDLDFFEKLGFAIMVSYGGVVIAGLMAVGIVWDNKPAFLFALAAAIFAWFSAFTVAFDKPRAFGTLVGIALFAIAGSITAIVI